MKLRIGNRRNLALSLFVIFFLTIPAMTWCQPVLDLTAGGETFEGKVSELQFPTTITIESGGTSWTLNALGSGLRTKFRIKVYEGVLYADDTAVLEDEQKRIAHQTARALRIDMHFRRDVDAEKIVNAFRDGFKKSIPEEMKEKLAADQEIFLSGFEDKLMKEDVIALTWLPGVGLVTQINGSQKTVVDNSDLATALFLIWIGDDPVNGGMKKDLFRLQ